MYFDEATGRWFSSQRDAERVNLWVAVRHGELRPIEGFSNYTINAEGQIINISRARALRPYSINGRLAVGLVDDDGRQRTLGLARLVATHFIPMPEDQEQYYDVVHLDEDPTNVNPANLQWVPRWKRHANPNNYDLDIS